MNHCGTQTLESERLILRRYQSEDYKAMYKNWASDPEVTKYLMWPTHPNEEVSKSVTEEWITNYSNEKYYIDDPDICFCKPDLTEKVNTTYRVGYIGGTSQGRRIYSIKGVTPTFVCQARGPAGGMEAYFCKRL